MEHPLRRVFQVELDEAGGSDVCDRVLLGEKFMVRELRFSFEFRQQGQRGEAAVKARSIAPMGSPLHRADYILAVPLILRYLVSGRIRLETSEQVGS